MTEPAVSRETSTPDAPWGLNSRGKPYVRDPATYASRTKSGRRGGSSPAAPKRKATPNRPAATEAQTAQRAQAVWEVLTIPTAGLAGYGQMSGNRAFIADAIVLSRQAPAIARAVADVAAERDDVAQIVDKLVSTGPYAALFTAVLPVVVQVTANHFPRLGSALGVVGAVSAEDVIRSATVPAPAGEEAPPAPAAEPEYPKTTPDHSVI